MLNLAQLLRVPQVDSIFDISPDNSRLAFAWNKTGERQIYELSPSPLTPLPKGEGNILQLTSGIGGKFNPRYSPDGSRLAYVLDVDGSESYHLVLYDYATNQHTDLTPNIVHALQPNFCWSPDGSQLALLSNEQGHFSAYVMPSTGGDAQLILDTGHPAWQVEWSPDGNHLAVCCEMHGQDYGIFVVELCHPERRPAPRRVSDVSGEIPLNAHAPQWSPDGRELAFHSDAHGWFDIGYYALGSKEIIWLTNDEGDSQNVCWSGDSQVSYTQSNGAVNWAEVCHAEGRSLP